MKIVEVSRGLGMGGAENSLFNRLSFVIGHRNISGDQVSIINSNPAANYFEKPLRDLGVRVSSTHTASIVAGSLELVKMAQSAEEGTIWVSHSPMAALPIKATAAWGLRHLKLVDLANSTRYKTSLEIVGRGINRYSWKCIAVSDAVARSGVVRGYANVDVVRPGIDLDRIRNRIASPIDELEELRSSFGITSDRGRLIVSVGRLDRLKGHHLLIEALADDALRDMHLVVVGDGPERAELERISHRLGLSSRVHLVGMQADPLPWMYASDFLVHPSEYEGLPLTLVEARSLGVPIIATDVGGIPEALFGYTGGQLLRSRTLSELVFRISSLDQRLGDYAREVRTRPAVPDPAWGVGPAAVAFYAALGLDTQSWKS